MFNCLIICVNETKSNIVLTGIITMLKGRTGGSQRNPIEDLGKLCLNSQRVLKEQKIIIPK